MSIASTDFRFAAFTPTLRRIRAQWQRPRSPQSIALVLVAWMLVTCNLALIREMAATGAHVAFWIGLWTIDACGAAVLLALFAWGRAIKPAGLAIVGAAATAQYFMWSFGIVLDPDMISNVLQTDLREARDLLSPRLLLQVLLITGLPAVWLIPLRIERQRLRRAAARNALLLAGSFALAAGVAFATFHELAPGLRNSRTLQYLPNPLSPVMTVVKQVSRPWRKPHGALVSITAGAALGPTYAKNVKPPMLVIVVGETARADHFALNGYRRDTTPQLAERGAISFGEVRSCGTSTLASVPCMFSSLGKQAYENNRAQHENLLDVLQAAGLAVLWIDNQSGCKGVCARVPMVDTADRVKTAAGQRYCEGGECRDEMLLDGIDAQVAALPAERRDRGVVLVMHQMGSHGPAYHKRSAAEDKRFLPECVDPAIGSCAPDQLINAYDNTIAQTDRVLARTIDWLGAQSARYATGLLYLSDHGESLGEYGLFLHGLPYSIAPDVQKHVPLIAWLAGGIGSRSAIDTACLARRRGDPLTHDNLYPTVLGLLDVRSPTYRPALDAFAACRRTAGSEAA